MMKIQSIHDNIKEEFGSKKGRGKLWKDGDRTVIKEKKRQFKDQITKLKHMKAPVKSSPAGSPNCNFEVTQI